MKDHISICICTYRRNRMLQKLLGTLAHQETHGLFDYSIVVVDNDVGRHAEKSVAAAGDELGVEITYGVEEERTIPAARNHALRLARGNYIAIVDDDELAPACWLLHLYRGIQTFGVDGALGPVHPFFEQQPPQWLIRSRLCERPTLRTGTLLHWDDTRTGNVLLKRSVFDVHDLQFDPSFRTGGSDREFFKQAMGKGCRFVAIDEAPVYEMVPPERWEKSYYFRRALVNGANAYRISLDRTSRASRIMLMMKSIVALFGYAVVLPPARLRGSHVAVVCTVKGLHHLSRVLTMCGLEPLKKRNF